MSDGDGPLLRSGKFMASAGAQLVGLVGGYFAWIVADPCGEATTFECPSSIDPRFCDFPDAPSLDRCFGPWQWDDPLAAMGTLGLIGTIAAGLIWLAGTILERDA
jgi:hypothetical protein